MKINMPKIDKVKRNFPVAIKATKKKSKSKKSKASAIDYYNCLLTQAQNDWFDSTTGTKKKITACCSDCKHNAPKISAYREQEINRLITSYQQVGESLKKLLKPIK